MSSDVPNSEGSIPEGPSGPDVPHAAGESLLQPTDQSGQKAVEAADGVPGKVRQEQGNLFNSGFQALEDPIKVNEGHQAIPAPGEAPGQEPAPPNPEAENPPGEYEDLPPPEPPDEPPAPPDHADLPDELEGIPPDLMPEVIERNLIRRLSGGPRGATVDEIISRIPEGIDRVDGFGESGEMRNADSPGIRYILMRRARNGTNGHVIAVTIEKNGSDWGYRFGLAGSGPTIKYLGRDGTFHSARQGVPQTAEFVELTTIPLAPPSPGIEALIRLAQNRTASSL